MLCLVACAACMAFCITGPWGGLGLLGRRTELYPRSFAVTLGDLDGDGDLDALAANRTTATVWLNDGAGRFTDSGQAILYSCRDALTLGIWMAMAMPTF